ncbi:flagellar hook-basal body complex protein FliE [Roseibacterium sp. SDUM158017]|uniref:flagellar hook-basal body complex protein FliE n=1 Tax=Roseicyclus salinarum TaxID=3036773 RepID=UPI0024157377|nr:flagellar hook-basal body complex protein FliE [Roseibacterium sp. SDUM158017]MDG4648624.1 flagellar hook-basal body complex protein FliE [Roseibacterium sp. SDUM158017]
MTDISSVVSTAAIQGAYRSSQSLSTAAREPSASGGETFSDMLRDVTAGAVNTARTAEGVAAAGLRGEMDTQSVVEATLELETTLRIAVSMRDKLVQAYQEVLRMPI